MQRILHLIRLVTIVTLSFGLWSSAEMLSVVSAGSGYGLSYSAQDNCVLTDSYARDFEADLVYRYLHTSTNIYAYLLPDLQPRLLCVRALWRLWRAVSQLGGGGGGGDRRGLPGRVHGGRGAVQIRGLQAQPRRPLLVG